MYTFGSMENVPFLLDEVGALEAAVTHEFNAQNVEAARTVAEGQDDIDALKKEVVQHDEVITARPAGRKKGGRERLEELRRKLADVKYELAVIKSPVLILPYEVMAEIFNWHMLMGGSLTTMLLVCTRWTTVAYSSPRLWSRIAVSDRDHAQLRLQGGIRCTTLDHLHSVLSHSQSSPLQIELSFITYAESVSGNNSTLSSSLRRGPQASANRFEAAKLLLNNRNLQRCTFLILGSGFVSFNFQGPLMAVEEMTVLPLLSSLYIDRTIGDREIRFIHSLIKFSPSLRHIRCESSNFSLQDIGLGVWVKRIESYGWIFPDASCHLLHESPSLREIGICGDTFIPLTFPALQVLRWAAPAYSRMHLIAAPHLHTIIIFHPPMPVEHLSPGSINLPNLRVAIHTSLPDLMTLHEFQTPSLEHLSIQSPTPSPTALFELFDGSTHMPTPKSLHLECAFTDAALVTVLGRLPWLEELRIAGTIAQDAFWEALTPSSNPSWRVWLPDSYPDERASRVLVPSLKVLLVDYSKVIVHTQPTLQRTEGKRVTREQRTKMTIASELRSKGGEWTARQASAVAIARERTGCPLGTLACWSPEQKVKMLIGSLETLPQRPK